MTRHELQTSLSEYFQLTHDECLQKALSCTQCELHTTRNKVVFGQGPVPCKIMCIGEGPGADEDAQGIPFVGRAGQLLTRMLEAIDLKRPADVYIANTVKCRPPQNRTPFSEEINACHDYLLKQIADVKPQIMVLLGSPAMKTILKPDESISKIRGKWFEISVDYQEEPLHVMTIFHPSYLLRNNTSKKNSPKWLTWQDLKEIRKRLDSL